MSKIIRNDRRQALLLGAGSQIAPFLSHRLARAGWSGDALSRCAPPPQPPLDLAFPWRPFDAADCRKIPEGAEVVFSTLPLWLLPPLVSYLRGSKQIVAFSSTSVFTKAASPDPAERELAARLAASEKELLDACRSNGIACSLLRPTLIYGTGRDQNVSAIASFIRRFGFFPVIYPGRGLRQPVHADDLAVAAVACLDNPAPQGQALDLPGGETLTFREMVKRVFFAMRRNPLIIPVPRFLVVRPATRLAKFFPKGYSPALLSRINEDHCFSVAAAAQALGYRPRAFRLEARVLAEKSDDLVS